MSNIPVQRYAVANKIISTHLPPISIQVHESFAYAGDLQFTLFEVAHVHIFVFLVTAGTLIKRLFRVQFEGYLDNNAHTYDYSIPDRITLGAYEYMHNSAVYNLREALQQRPKSDTGQLMAYLQAKGYQLPEHVMIERFIRLLDAMKRNEVLFIYLEDLSDTGFIADDFNEGGRGLAQWQQIGPGLLERALSSFKIVDG
jgi:hypothetical protein